MKIALTLLLIAPLIGALINGLKWERPHIWPAFLISGSACFVSFLSALFLFFSLPENPLPPISFFEWISLGDFKVSFSFLIDPLSVFMLLLITGVGFLIHLFSVYYMSHDPRPAKYFAYLNLFVFCMIHLVLADNLLLMFLGWEGVGLCSYLLIGFWFEKKEKAMAGMKAFIVNRIGDMGFALGLFLLFLEFSSLEFLTISHQVTEGAFNLSTVKWACLCLFIGAVGKSAQIPLYIWLPSAMAGPTPVSALIHSATMVTAGIYLMARLSFLFTLSPEVMTLISYIGALTALLSALIATAQSDIKKVLAYSTVSQLGYMVLACGVGAFTAGLFHLLTHGFFKGLLFLSAGALIHALHGEQNIHRMGGLRKQLPWTHLYFMVGFLALIGTPPLSGFFSKDEILWSVFASQHKGLWAVGFLTAGLTAFYMTRLFILVFYGKSRLNPRLKPKEGGFSAQLPLIVLALLSLLGGFLGIPHVISSWLSSHPPHLIESYLKPVVTHTAFKGPHWIEILLMLSAVFLALSVSGATGWLYLKKKADLLKIKQKNKGFFTVLESALQVDRFCYKKIVQPVLNISQALWKDVEEGLINGLILYLQKWLLTLREIFKTLQNGRTQSYILFMVLGVLVSLLAVLIR